MILLHISPIHFNKLHSFQSYLNILTTFRKDEKVSLYSLCTPTHGVTISVHALVLFFLDL